MMSKKRKTSASKAAKEYVRHHYVDHAFDPWFEDKERYTGGATIPFPIKLHRMLDQIENEEKELKSTVSWQPHGRCFVVHEPKLFEESVLGRFFQQNKYQSFQRQLNLYGFRRITKGPDRGGYYHELFLRNREFLCCKMKRTKVKGTGFRKASDTTTEPNFYDMSPVLAVGVELKLAAAAITGGVAPTGVDPGQAGMVLGGNFNYNYNEHPAATQPQGQMELFQGTSTTQSMDSFQQLQQQQQQQRQQEYQQQLFQYQQQQQQLLNTVYVENTNHLQQNRRSSLSRASFAALNHDPDYDFNNMPIHPVHGRRHSLLDYHQQGQNTVNTNANSNASANVNVNANASESSSTTGSFFQNFFRNSHANSNTDASQPHFNTQSSSRSPSFRKKRCDSGSSGGGSRGSGGRGKKSSPPKGNELRFFFNPSRSGPDTKQKGSRHNASSIQGSIGDLKFFIP